MTEPRSFGVILIVVSLPLVIFGGWRLVEPIGIPLQARAQYREFGGRWSAARREAKRKS